MDEKTNAKVKSKIVDQPNYYRQGSNGIFRSSDNRVFSFAANAAEDRNWSENLSMFYSKSIWDKNRLSIGGTDIISYGPNNNLPMMIRDLLEDQHLGEGVFKNKKNFLYGQGPCLYTIDYDAEGKRVKKFIKDEEVLAWLKTWKYEEYLRRLIVDYYHAEMCYSKVFRNRGPRVGAAGMISKLEHVGVHNARLGFPENGQIVRIQTADYDYSRNFVLYPVFDKFEPFRFGVSMAYSNNYSFARDFYPVPSYYGTLNWLGRSAAVPKVLKNLTDQSLNIRWHIESPASYWLDMEEKLRKQKEDIEGVKYTDDMLDELMDETFRKMSDVLSGVKNVGKFFTSQTAYDEFGNCQQWKITPIDQKVKEYIEGQIAIAKYADVATMSGLGLAPSLSNVMIEGLNSGSEKLYDYKLYMATQVDIDEVVVCQVLNDAIAANWPDKDIKIGFYHDAVNADANITPALRIKNAVK